jgi:hypothetical protein
MAIAGVNAVIFTSVWLELGYSCDTLVCSSSMAFYKYRGFLTESEDAKFEDLRLPGSLAPVTGVYRCETCGREVVSEEHRRLPSSGHHLHSPGQLGIRWRLIVAEQV